MALAAVGELRGVRVGVTASYSPSAGWDLSAAAADVDLAALADALEWQIRPSLPATAEIEAIEVRYRSIRFIDGDLGANGSW